MKPSGHWWGAIAGFAAFACATGADVGHVTVLAGGAGGTSGTGGLPGSGGAAGSGTGATGGSGGTAGVGGASGVGGVAGTAGVGGTSGSGGAAGSAGTSGVGGAAGSAGTAGSGGGTAGSAGVAGSGGAAGCVAGANADGDCADDWTDPAIFNGFHVSQAYQCSADGNCGENDTLAKVDACMAKETTEEEKDQCAGWDWQDPPNDLCDPGYGFTPPWTHCSTHWQAEWRGVVHLASAGKHCFIIEGGTSEGCAALYFDTQTAPIQTGAPAQCFDVAAGQYPLRMHYTMDNGSSSSVHLRYCAGGAAACTPTAALPASMLRAQ